MESDAGWDWYRVTDEAPGTVNWSLNVSTHILNQSCRLHNGSARLTPYQSSRSPSPLRMLKIQKA